MDKNNLYDINSGLEQCLPPDEVDQDSSIYYEDEFANFELIGDRPLYADLDTKDYRSLVLIYSAIYGVTQADAAKAMNITPLTLSRNINNDNLQPTNRFKQGIKQLAAAVSMQDLSQTFNSLILYIRNVQYELFCNAAYESLKACYNPGSKYTSTLEYFKSEPLYHLFAFITFFYPEKGCRSVLIPVDTAASSPVNMAIFASRMLDAFDKYSSYGPDDETILLFDDESAFNEAKNYLVFAIPEKQKHLYGIMLFNPKTHQIDKHDLLEAPRSSNQED